MSEGILNSISIKSVLGNGGTKDLLPELIKLKDEKNKILPLMKLYGIAQRVRTGAKDDREFIQFIGEFEAYNLINGKHYTSGRAYVQDYIADQIYSQMRDAVTGELKEAQFALQIGAHYDATCITSYVYDVSTLVTPHQTDKMKALKNLATQPLQLETSVNEPLTLTKLDIYEDIEEQPGEEIDFLHGDIDHIVPPATDESIDRLFTNETVQAHVESETITGVRLRDKQRQMQHQKSKHDK